MNNIYTHSKKKTSSSYEDVKLGMVKHDKGGLRYLDLNGIKKRWSYAAWLVGVCRCQAAFDTIMIASICRNKSTGASAELDQQVINLIAGLRADGSGKEVFQDIGALPITKPIRNSNK